MTDWLLDPDRVKVYWRLVWINVGAAVINTVIGLVFFKWISIANFLAAAFSGYQAYRRWQDIPRVRREQEQRIIELLRGRDGRITQET